MTATASLELDPATVARKRYAVTKLKQHLKDLTTADAALDKELADVIRALTPAESDTNAKSASNAPPPLPGGKKSVAASPSKVVPKAPASATIPSAANEEIMARREESAARKAVIEETHAKILIEERAVNALLACAGVEATVASLSHAASWRGAQGTPGS